MTSSSSGCFYSVSSNSSTNYNLNANKKLCITGGTYTGTATLNGGTIVVDNNAVFNPATMPVSGTGNVIEIKGLCSATIPGMNISSNVDITLNNCGTVNFTAIAKASTSATMYINNNGVIHSTSDFQYSSGSYGTICNSGEMYFVNLTMSSGTNSFINNGTVILSGNMSLSNSASVTLCSASYAEVDGSWNGSSGATMNSPTSCGRLRVHGNSNCSSCNIAGYLDFCDSSGVAPTVSPPNPMVDNNSGGTWASTVTYCQCSGTVLPITLADFKAVAADDKVTVEWKTATEINNDYFTVERSADGWDYAPLMKVKGAGNSTEPLSYSINDDSPLPGTSYYRLRQTDFDGRIAVFPPVAVNAKKALVYLSATGNKLKVYIDSGDEFTTVDIYDVSGQKVFSKNEHLISGLNILTYDLSLLNDAVYILKTESVNKVFVGRFIKGQ